MSHASPHSRRSGYWEPDPARPNATTTDAQIKKLYGPNGEVLRTFSDRPPVGFHQGTRYSDNHGR